MLRNAFGRVRDKVNMNSMWLMQNYRKTLLPSGQLVGHSSMDHQCEVNNGCVLFYTKEVARPTNFFTAAFVKSYSLWCLKSSGTFICIVSRMKFSGLVSKSFKVYSKWIVFKFYSIIHVKQHIQLIKLSFECSGKFFLHI